LEKIESGESKTKSLSEVMGKYDLDNWNVRRFRNIFK
jgi:hypothetical protein